jgi:RNA polymerase sigma factor FliA
MTAKKTTTKRKSKVTQLTKVPKKVTKKPTAKKATAKKATAKKATAKKAPTKKAIAKAPAKKVPVAKKKATRKKAVAKRKSPLPVEEMQTEDIWGLYRKAYDGGEKTAAELEKLRNILMERHYPLVKYIAERLLQTLPKSIEVDDLISAGLFGLMDAIRGFDPGRGIKFKTYCTTRIRGSILDQLRSQDWVPRLVRLKAGRIEKALQRLTGEYGREPTHAELAKTLDMDHADLTKEISSASAKAMFSLSDKWEDRDDDNSMEKVDVLEDKRSVDPIGDLHRRDLMQYITRSLTHKERFIIEQYYQVGHTMREIGEMLALTESRVCQIHSNVMGRLKGLLGQKMGTLLM